MGIEHKKDEKEDPFSMNVYLIGTNLFSFYDIIKNFKKENCSIKKHWKFSYEFKNENTKEIIDKYFQKLNDNMNSVDTTIKVKETLIIKVKNIFDPEVSFIIQKTNELEETKFMPLILFLVENYDEHNQTINYDRENNIYIDPRLFFIAQFSDDEKYIKEFIDPILYRICSIHNELGDRFTVGEGKDAEDYDLIKNYFPFNVNIACIGRFGQGKSTGVNAILQEYKAKESSTGSSQTKHLTFYQQSNYPVRILDIPGFEKEDHVQKAIEKFRLCGDKINKIKDNLHIILYFININGTRTFQELEAPILEEIIKHKTCKIIYVMTHCNKNISQNQKARKIRQIYEGIQGITKKNDAVFKETLEGGMLFPSLNNVVFVNFHKNYMDGSEPFGKKDLFKVIHDSFIQSEDYQKSLEKLDENIIKENADKLRARGKELLLANKVWGGVVGIIPGLDWVLQKFVVKKNATKKLGQLFGIDVRFVEDNKKQTNKKDEEKVKKKEKEKEKEKEKQNENKETPFKEYITKGMDDEQFTLKGEELIEDTKTEKVGNSVRITGEAGSYIGGGVAVGQGIIRAASTIGQTASEGISTATSVAVGVGGTVLKVVGASFFIVGAIAGVSVGGYFTHKYCEDLLDKFVEFYKANAKKISNSYLEAEKYFSNVDD